jgi:hypothetical protein
MKICTGILLVLILCGCSDKTPFQTGTYSNVKISNIELGYLFLTKGVKSYFVGSELVLNKDSTFKYTTCGNIMNGSWYNFNDSLFLKVISNRWRIDSLNKFGFNGIWPKIPPKPIGFKIKNDYLEEIVTMKTGKKLIQRLKFNVP